MQKGKQQQQAAGEPRTDKLLSIAQAADILGIRTTKFFELVNERGLPTIKLGHRSTRIDPVDLYKWIDEQKQGG